MAAARVAPSSAPLPPVKGSKVSTAYGEGQVVHIRPIDGVIVTKLAYGTAYLQPGAASRVAARHEPGARVKTPYGDAQVLQSREADGSYVVELTKWTLAEPADVNAPRRRPLAYLQPDMITGVRHSKSAQERLWDGIKLKALGTEQYKAKALPEAAALYKKAIQELSLYLDVTALSSMERRLCREHVVTTHLNLALVLTLTGNAAQAIKVAGAVVDTVDSRDDTGKRSKALLRRASASVHDSVRDYEGALRDLKRAHAYEAALPADRRDAKVVAQISKLHAQAKKGKAAQRKRESKALGGFLARDPGALSADASDSDLGTPTSAGGAPAAGRSPAPAGGAGRGRAGDDKAPAAGAGTGAAGGSDGGGAKAVGLLKTTPDALKGGLDYESAMFAGIIGVGLALAVVAGVWLSRRSR